MASEELPSAAPFIVGLVGGIVALKFSPGQSWPERAFHVVCAGASAGLLGPALTEWVGLTSPAMQSAAAFLVGLFGLNLTAAAFEWIKAVKLSDLVPWFRRGE